MGYDLSSSNFNNIFGLLNINDIQILLSYCKNGERDLAINHCKKIYEKYLPIEILTYMLEVADNNMQIILSKASIDYDSIDSTNIYRLLLCIHALCAINT